MSIEIEMSSILARYSNNQLVAKVKGSYTGQFLRKVLYNMEIEYDALKEEAVRFLDRHKILFLATCADERVTARAMS